MTSNSASLRVGHAERQRTTESLKAAYVDGRLDEEELEDRIGRALSARTAADLDALLADLDSTSPAAGRAPAPSAPPPQSFPQRAAGQLVSLARCVLCCGR